MVMGMSNTLIPILLITGPLLVYSLGLTIMWAINGKVDK